MCWKCLYIATLLLKLLFSFHGKSRPCTGEVVLVWQEELPYTTRRLFRETDRAIGYKYVSATLKLENDGTQTASIPQHIFQYGKTVGWGGGRAAQGRTEGCGQLPRHSRRDNPQTENQAITSMYL